MSILWPDNVTWLATASWYVLQTALLLLLATTPLLAAVLLTGRRLRAAGHIAAARAVLRATIGCLVLLIVLVGLLPLLQEVPPTTVSVIPESTPPLTNQALSMGYGIVEGSSGSDHGRNQTTTFAVTPPLSQPTDVGAVTTAAPAVAPSVATTPVTGWHGLIAATDEYKDHDYSLWYQSAATAWAFIAAEFFVALGISHLFLRRLRGEAQLVPGDSFATRTVLQLAADAHLTRRPEVRTHSRIRVPCVACFPFAAPVVLLPEDYTERFEPDVLGPVLAHEIAHLRADDHSWIVLARTIAFLLWFQPLGWLLLRQLIAVQEMSCDQEALRGAGRTISPPAYATCLLNVAEAERNPASRFQRLSTDTAAMGVVSSATVLEERIRHVLGITGAGSLPANLSRKIRLGIVGSTLTAAGVGVLTVAASARALTLPHVPLSAFDAERRFLMPRPVPPTLTAELKTIPWGPGKVQSVWDVSATNVSLLEILERIATTTHRKLVIDSAMTRTGLVGNRANLVTYGSDTTRTIGLVLAATTKPTPFGYTLTDRELRVCVVTLGPDKLPVKQVSLDYPQGTSLLTVLDALCAGTGVHCGGWMSLPIDNATLAAPVHLVNQPFRTALETVLSHARPRMIYKAEGRAVISLVPDPNPAEVGDDVLPAAKVTLQAQKVPVRQALNQICQQAGNVSWTIADDVTGTVTDSFSGLPLRQALPHLLQHASTPLQVHIYQEEITPGLIESGMPVPYIVVDRQPSRR